MTDDKPEYTVWGTQPCVMAIAVARAYNGLRGLCPQWGPGAKPLIKVLGGEVPLKLKAI